MITVHQLAEIISRSPKGTALKQTSQQPGKERFTGLCPLHNEQTPSFDVFVGYDGAGHYYCHGCHQGGSAEWWLRKVEGRGTVAVPKPDPELLRKREEARARELMLRDWRDAHPDTPPEAEGFLAIDDLTLLQHRLRRKLT